MRPAQRNLSIVIGRAAAVPGTTLRVTAVDPRASPARLPGIVPPVRRQSSTRGRRVVPALALTAAAVLHLALIALFSLDRVDPPVQQLRSAGLALVPIPVPSIAPPPEPEPASPPVRLAQNPFPPPALPLPTIEMSQSLSDRTPALAPAPPSSHSISVSPVAPTPRPAVTLSSIPPSWIGRIMARLAGVRRYPDAAKAARQEGTAFVRFTIDRTGHVLASRVERGSGVDLLDAEAIRMLARADPLPPPPDEVPGDPVELVVPMEFRLK